MELFITGRGKKEYLSEKMEIPKETDDKFSTWEAENSMIMSWILSSMTPEVGNVFMLYSTAAAIWKAAKDMYSKRDNIAELYELETQLRDTKQGDQTVSKFFSSLSQIWQQIDSLEVYQWECSKDTQLYVKIKETKRVFGFLAGLHKDLDAVRGRILSTKPLPSINEAFSEVRQEESRIKVMLGPHAVVSSESSALVSHEENKTQIVGLNSRKVNHNEYRSSNKKYCRYCQRDGHVIEECYRRPGSQVKPPPYFRQNHFKQGHSGKTDCNNTRRSDADSWRSPRATIADAGPSTSEPVFTQAHLDAVLRVIDSQRSQSQNDQIRATMACIGKGGKSAQTWIVDSGATNHMTFDKSQLREFEYFAVPKRVKVANGESIDILGHGNIRLSDTLMLKQVLYVPKLDCNLVSVRQLMSDNCCLTLFTPFECFFLPSSSFCFQGKTMKEEMIQRMIGSANHCKGLYVL